MLYRLAPINFPDHKHINTYFRKVKKKERKKEKKKDTKGHLKK